LVLSVRDLGFRAQKNAAQSLRLPEEIPDSKNPCDVGVFCERLSRAHLQRSPLTGAKSKKQSACHFDYSGKSLNYLKNFRCSFSVNRRLDASLRIFCAIAKFEAEQTGVV